MIKPGIINFVIEKRFIPGYLFFIALFAYSTMTNATEDSRLTLSESVAFALKNNLQILAQNETLKGAEATVDESRSSYYPLIRLESNYNRLNTFSTFKFAFPGLPADEIKLGTADNYNVQIALSHSIFNWERNVKTVKLSKLQRATAQGDLSIVERQITYLVIQYFYQILMTEKAISVVDGNLSLLRQRHSMMKEKYENGEMSAFDIISVEVQIGSAEGRKLETETDLDKLRLTFNLLTARSADAPVMLSGSLTYIPVTIDEKSILQGVSSRRLELRQLEIRQKGALLQRQIASTLNKPNLDFNFTWELKNGYLPNVDNFKSGWSAGLTCSLPLFDGFRTNSQVRQAEANYRTMVKKYDELNEATKTEVRQAILDLKMAARSVETEKTNVAMTEQALHIAEERYDQGLLSTLDLLSTQLEHEDASLNYLRALCNHTLSRSRLQYVTGAEFDLEALGK